MVPTISAASRLHATELVKLDYVGHADMACIVTETGRSITLTPESFFALDIRGGRVGIACEAPSGGEASGEMSAWLQEPAPFPKAAPQLADPRLWFIAGLVVSTGKFVGSQSVPGRITLRAEMESLIDPVKQVLSAYADSIQLRDKNGQPHRIITKASWAGTEISSHIVDRILSGPLQSLVKPLTHEVCFPKLLGDACARQGFFAGLIAGMEPVAGGRRFIHRDSRMIRACNDFLFRMGVPTIPNIHPHEPSVQAHTRGCNPHHLLLLDEHAQFVDAAGLLALPSTSMASRPVAFYDKVVSIRRAGRCEAIAIQADEPVVAEDFRLLPRFSVPAAALDLASMAELFAEVTEPSAVLARSHPHRTHAHGEI